MTQVIFRLFVDFNDNLLFGEPSDGEDISPRLMRFETKLGMRQPFDRIAVPAEGLFYLDNADDYFEQERSGPSSAPPLTGRYLQLAIGAGLSWTPQFTGVIRSVKLSGDGLVAEVRADGRLYYANVTADVALYVSETVDTIMTDVLDDWRFREILQTDADDYPVAILDQQAAELDSAALAEEQYGIQLDAGIQTLPYFGDPYETPPTLLQVLSDLTYADYGWLFEDKRAYITYYNRHHFAVSAAATIEPYTAAMLENYEYEHGGQLYNRVDIEVVPRSAQVSALVWTSELEIRIEARSVLEFKLKFTQADGRVVGVIGTPTISNWTWYDDGNDPLEGDIAVTLIGMASGVLVQVVNENRDAGTLQIGAQIYGAVLTKGDPVTVRAEDRVSAALYGERRHVLPTSAITDLDFAQSLAAFLVQRWSTPLGFLRSVTLRNKDADNVTQQTDRNLFDIIQVDLTNEIGHSNYYLIVGIQNVGDNGGYELLTTYILCPYNFFAVLDQTGLNILDDPQTRLGL